MDEVHCLFCYGIFRLSCLGQKFLACGIRYRINYLSIFQQEFRRNTPLNFIQFKPNSQDVFRYQKSGKDRDFSGFKMNVWLVKMENRSIPYTNQPLSIFVFG